MDKRTHIIVHHTGAEEKDAAQVRRYHLSLGWRDVGYNYIIERGGRVVEGRSLEIPGAHCRANGMNVQSVGVAIIGNLEKHPPTGIQVDKLSTLLLELMAAHNIPPGRVLGHNEVPGAATACPGRCINMDMLRSKLSDPLPEPIGSVLWRVLAGAYRNREEAVKGKQGDGSAASQPLGSTGTVLLLPRQLPGMGRLSSLFCRTGKR